jgi:hypothetical protein
LTESARGPTIQSADMTDDDEPTTQELKARVIKQAEQDPRRAAKARYLKEKLDERERSEREAGLTDDDVPPDP